MYDPISVGAPESERPGHANPPVPVRYTDCNPGSNRAKTYTLDKEEAKQPVLYHSIGPVAKGTASHMYTDELLYQCADTDVQCPSQSTTSAVQVRNIYDAIMISIMKSCMFTFFIPGSSSI